MESKSAANDDDPPSAAKAVIEGYNQTYLIMKNNEDNESKANASSDGHEVFFRCGNWCYSGRIQFGSLTLSTAQLPVIIPTLQKQQGSLRYYCNSTK